MDNLYREYYFKVGKEIVREGKNSLRIDIESTVKYTFEHHANYTGHYGNVANSFDWQYVWLTPQFVE